MPAKNRRPRSRRRERRGALPHPQSHSTPKSRMDRFLDFTKIAVGLAAVFSNFFFKS
jgi:hypothetical protein